MSAYAFKGCASLKTVTLSKSVQFIGEAPFYGCTALEEIIVPEDNPKFQAIDGNLYSRDGKWLYQYALGKKDTSFVIPEGIGRIAQYAFAGCDSI